MDRIAANFISYCFIGLLLTTVYSCQKEDVEPPVISNVAMDGQALMSENLATAGSSIEISATFSDDMALNQARVAFVPADDYDPEDTTFTILEQQGEWSRIYVMDLQGTTASESRQFDIPDDIRGSWFLTIDLIDDSGNFAEDTWFHFVVENQLLPVISINSISPAANEDDEIIVEPGGELSILGNVTDDLGLDQIEYSLTNTVSDSVYWSLESDAMNATTVQIQQSVNVPTDSGLNLSFLIRALDSDGYVSEEEILLETE